MSLLLLAGTPSVHAYYGRHSEEAELTYQTHADIILAGKPKVAELNRNGKLRTEILARIDEQVQHLMGTFQSESFKKEFGYPGVLGEGYRVRFTGISDGSAKGRKLVSYDFTGTVVFQKEAFSGHGSRLVPIKLPLAPDLVYALGVVGDENRCTDEHYNGEDDFWYFWDPDMQGCPLKKNDSDVIRSMGRLARRLNTPLAYPEYDRLYGDNGNGDTFDIALFFGYIDDLKNIRRPHRGDDGAQALKFVEADLRSRGFQLVDQLNAFREYANGRQVKGINFLRHFEKKVSTRLGTDILIRVQILLADTAIDSKDETFHRYLIPAFKDSDIVIYDGHSGLGGNLDLKSLPNSTFDQKKYQVFFFNGCSSYPYFNTMFHEAKGGSENLEIVLSGLPTLTATAGPNTVAFLDHFLDGETLSYQKILKDLEDSNGEYGTYLTGVTGEQDNRWKPAR